MSRQPLGQVPSVPRDLRVISKQHPRHDIKQIDNVGLFTVSGLFMRNPVQLLYHYIHCIYAFVSYCHHPSLNCRSNPYVR